MRTLSPRTAPASSNATLRRSNLSLLATLIHHGGPQSRAELTAVTGLTRSAISALIAELTELGWVEETSPTPTGRIGRPSPLVSPGARFAAIGVHVDTDALLIGLIGLNGEVIRRLRVDVHTPHSPRHLVDTIAATVNGLRTERGTQHRVVGLGVSIPGLVDTKAGRVLWTPTLPFKDVDLAARLARATHLPVTVTNNASAEGVAEARFGAGRGTDTMVYMAGQAGGIGGGMIIDGQPFTGASGFAAELGHTLVKTGGAACRCGRRGCLEAEVSLERLLDALGAPRLDQDQLDVALGTSRSPAVWAEVQRQLELLSQAIATAVHLFDPQLVVLGGFLGSLLSVGRERLSTDMTGPLLDEFRKRLRIERAALRSSLEIVGAAEQPLMDALADPAAFAA